MQRKYCNLLYLWCKMNFVCKNHTKISIMKLLQKIEIASYSKRAVNFANYAKIVLHIAT